MVSYVHMFNLNILKTISESCKADVYGSCQYLNRFLVLTEGKNIVYLRYLPTLNDSNNKPAGFKLWIGVCVRERWIFFYFWIILKKKTQHLVYSCATELLSWLLDVVQNHNLCLNKLGPLKPQSCNLRGRVACVN